MNIRHSDGPSNVGVAALTSGRHTHSAAHECDQGGEEQFSYSVGSTLAYLMFEDTTDIDGGTMQPQTGTIED